QAGDLGHQLDTGAEPCTQEGPGRESQATGRTDARLLLVIDAQRVRHYPGVMRQSSVQLLHLAGAGALLRPEDPRSAPRSAQGVIDIRRDLDLNPLQARIQHGTVDTRQPRQRSAASRQLAPIGVQQAYPQRLQQAGTSIVGSAAAESENDAPGTGIQ